MPFLYLIGVPAIIWKSGEEHQKRIIATGPEGWDFFFKDVGVANADAVSFCWDFSGVGFCKNEINDNELKISLFLPLPQSLQHLYCP